MHSICMVCVPGGKDFLSYTFFVPWTSKLAVNPLTFTRSFHERCELVRTKVGQGRFAVVPKYAPPGFGDGVVLAGCTAPARLQLVGGDQLQSLQPPQ